MHRNLQVIRTPNECADLNDRLHILKLVQTSTGSEEDFESSDQDFDHTVCTL